MQGLRLHHHDQLRGSRDGHQLPEWPQLAEPHPTGLVQDEQAIFLDDTKIEDNLLETTTTTAAENYLPTTRRKN